MLERMIIESIQLQMAQRMGLRVSDNDVNDALTNIAKQNQLSVPQFQQALRDDGIAYATFRQQVRRDMILSQLQQRVVGRRVKVSDQDVENFLNSQLGKERLAAEYRRTLRFEQ